jgi:hypothetical protein
MNYLKRLPIWLKQVLLWFYEGKLFWIFICIVALFAFLPCGYIYFGTGLQLLGIITIVKGINSKIKIFKSENPVKYHLKYFVRFPSFKGRTINASISESVVAQDISNADLIQRAKKPEQTFIDLIRYIDEEVIHINHQISTLRTNLDDQINDLTKKLGEQKQQIDTNINNVEKKIEMSNTSDISLELFGAGCIAAGLIFSILPSIWLLIQ